jgi:CRISPR-associated protein Cas2
MRLMVLFDLPVLTAAQRKNYARFHKFLETNGYLMMQESVYVKLAINERVAQGLLNKLHENCPPEGLVQVLKVTEKQFATIQTVGGQALEHDAIDSTDELVIL